MKLSFVIPAHNEEQYIGKCLDSIFHVIGNDPDFEVIVVNNNSTDRTREIAARYSKVIVVDEKKPGANSARDAGYRVAKADLIANVDADTMLTKGWIENALAAFAKEEKLVCLSGPFIYYDLAMHIRVLVRMFYVVSYIVYLFNHFIFRKSSIVQGGNFVVRKSALDKIGGFNTDLTFYGDDSDLARRLIKVGRVRWTFGFTINSSGRRLATEGTFTMGLRYGLNYFWIVLFNRPWSESSIVVRPPQNGKKLHYHPVNEIREGVIASCVFIFIIAVLAGFVYLGYIFIQSSIISAMTANIKMETNKAHDSFKTLQTKIQNAIDPNAIPGK